MPHTANPYGNSDAMSELDLLDSPLYSATFGEAVKRYFKKYATFSGRASRSEYWWAMLFNVLVGLVALAIAAAGGAFSVDPTSTETPIIALLGVMLLPIYAIFTFIPHLALGMRRFHDANFSGWLYPLYMVPYVGWPVVLILALMPSNPPGARFDKDWTLPAASRHPSPDTGIR